MRIADDELIIGHRNSEWTGIGPVLEEDIAFSSMAQDEIGHAQVYYMLLNEMFGMEDPDQVAFNRPVNEYRCSRFVEQPITDYAFSLIRHFLYDHAESVRLKNWLGSSFKPLSEMAKKFLREEKYHILHADTWVKQLGPATEESNQRMQAALDAALPMAYSLFEPTAMDETIANEGLQAREAELEATWEAEVKEIIEAAGLKWNPPADKTVFYGGRSGQHGEHLESLVKEMTEVFAIDPAANW